MTQHYTMLQRNLLYTGVTRGKRLVVLVGQKKAIAIAVRNISGRVGGRNWQSGCVPGSPSQGKSAWWAEPRMLGGADISGARKEERNGNYKPGKCTQGGGYHPPVVARGHAYASGDEQAPQFYRRAPYAHIFIAIICLALLTVWRF
jgi:hypothetical protein